MELSLRIRQLVLLSVLVPLALGWPVLHTGHALKLSLLPRSSSLPTTTASNGTAIIPLTTRVSQPLNTTLAGLVFILTLITFGLLTRYTADLANEIVFPTEFLEKNITALLSVAWRNRYHPSLQHRPKEDEHNWTMFHTPRSSGLWESAAAARKCDGVRFHDILGCDQVSEDQVSEDLLKTNDDGRSMAQVKILSPVMRSLLQIAVWNSVSFWLVLVMLVNTLVYNGYTTNNITNDSIIRLVLIGFYAAANLLHQRRTEVLLYRNFTYLMFQTCWSVICRRFMIVNNSDYLHAEASDISWLRFNVELLGKMELSGRHQTLKFSDDIGSSVDKKESGRTINDLYGNDPYAKKFVIWSNNDENRKTHLKVQDKIESKLGAFIKPLREAEIKAYEKAAESVLEKLLANVAVLTGICLVTALATWTSTAVIDATSVQLGSYGLLISTSTGTFALLAAFTQLINATESGQTLLRWQEMVVTKDDDSHEAEDIGDTLELRKAPSPSFSEGFQGATPLTAWGLWKSMNKSVDTKRKVAGLVFGPAWVLIPRLQNYRLCELGSTVLRLNVKGIDFLWFGSGDGCRDMIRLPASHVPS